MNRQALWREHPLTPFTLTLAAALALLPLAADARTSRPKPPRAQAATSQSASPSAPTTAEADLSSLQTTEYGTTERRPPWQANPTHHYDARGVDCTLYPVRCPR